MFAFAPYAPVFSPAIAPPPPPIDVASPPLIEPSSPPSYSAPPVTSPPTPYPPLTVPLPSNSAPPVKSPASSSPPMLSLPVPMPSNSAPPATPSPPVSSLPSPENVLTPPSPLITSNESPDSPPPSPPVSSSLSPGNVLTPPSSPLITSNGSPDSPLPSPVTPLPPTVPLSPPAAPAFQTPPFPFATAPATGTFPPSTVAPSPPTTTAIFPPPSTPPLSEEMPWPPLSPPPVNIPPLPSEPPSSGNLPVAVEVQKPSAFHMSSGLIIGLVTGTVIFLFVLAVVTVLCCNKKKNKQKNLSTYHSEEEEPSPPIRSKGSHVIQLLPNSTLPAHFTEGGGPSGTVNLGSLKAVSNHAPSMAFDSVNGIFTYDDLIVATNCFSESNLLGEGGFGYVYKGVLPCGKEIAVKQLKTGSQQGEREFQAEVETISRVHHKHLVELIGYCVTRAERLLVYEFVPNNTLEFHLHGEGKAVVEWATRMKIALGSAKGLAYLHEDCNPSIIHRDIKASNILLDFKFEAKVSDFGLAKIFHNTDNCITHLTTRVVGTFGYLAPEYASSGKLTEKSDVYSYGVMLLELITGRPPITSAGSRNGSLVDWARPLLAQALQGGNLNSIVDPSLQNNYKAEEMARMITCAAACVRHSAWLRPRMSQIVGALEGVVSLSDNSDYDATQYQQDIIRNFTLALSS